MWTDFIKPIWQVKAWPIGFKSNIFFIIMM